MFSTKYIRLFAPVALIFLLFSPASSFLRADTTTKVEESNVRAEILEVLDEEYRFIPGTGVEAFHQRLKARILEGGLSGEIVEMESQFHKFTPGDKVFIDIKEGFDGELFYILTEPDRRWPLLFLLALFVLVILSFSFKKGLRSILSLAISFAIILFLLLPKLLDGASPVPTTIFFATLIVALAMYITHGFNRTTHSAFLGTAVTLVLVGVLSRISVSATKLTGLSSHEALYLNLQTGGLLDISGLLLGAIVIGILGILDDVSITQSATVRELYRAKPDFTVKEVYQRALSVGREHMVSLVNTLALAYAGASLPLLLLFSQSDEGSLNLLNMEIFATEITRTLVGSIGLILAVPITTIIASFLLRPEGEKSIK